MNTRKPLSYVAGAFSVLIIFALSATAAPRKLTDNAPSGTQNTFREGCPFSQEFITANEYLRSQKDFGIPEPEARKLATQAAGGCIGAAKRFIRVTSMLTHAGLLPKDAVQSGLQFAARTEAETEAFITVFHRAFHKAYLDLDINSALKMAHSLSTQFEGNVAAARDDFATIVEFCAHEDGLDLPRPACGEMGARIARLGQNFGGGISNHFLNAFDFLRSKKGPALPTGAALKQAEELVGMGLVSVENFIQAFRYAASKSGLQMDNAAAMTFAKEMAQKAYRKID